MSTITITITDFLYKKIIKKFLFLKDPESVHLRTVRLGERMGDKPFVKNLLSSIFCGNDEALHQRLFGLDFKSPIGLSAGFDYEARLTQVLPSIGFGFGTVGTLTLRPYGGNRRPMLGRLPRSRSLMVNKGYKNFGVKATLEHLEGKTFEYPVGVSIGKTNNIDIKTQREGVLDVVGGFKEAETSLVPFSYYELNISCPNLAGSVEFYMPNHLIELLSELNKLNIIKPVFVKMPISNTDEEIRAMMDVIVRYPFIKAVILGNLQRNRKDPALVPEEVARFPVGNFSGVPCRERSDELINLVYKNYGTKIKIVGCGGVFSAEDAYRKIKLGASLVQLITGLIFEGPQLIAQINRGLGEMARRDGYSSISEVIGKGV